MKSSVNNQRGSALVIELVVLAAVVVAAAFAYYNFEKTKNSVNSANKPIPHVVKSTPTPSVSPISASCNAKANSSTPSGWNTASSGMAGFSLSYPASWLCRTSSNNGGAEVIDIDSSSYSAGTPYFDIEFLSFTSTDEYGRDSLQANPSLICQGCLGVNYTDPFTAPGYGPLQLLSVKEGVGGGYMNQLLLETPGGSVALGSSRTKGVYTGGTGNFQNESEDSLTQETYAEFSKDSTVQTAEQIMKTFYY